MDIVEIVEYGRIHTASSEAVRGLTSHKCEGEKEKLCCGLDSKSAWECHVLEAAAGLRSCHNWRRGLLAGLLAGLPGTPLYEAGIRLVQTDL